MCAPSLIQNGISLLLPSMWKRRRNPVSPTKNSCPATSSETMMPIVFCASFAPCESEKSAELVICIPRKSGSTAAGRDFRKIQLVATMSAQPAAMPIIGERTMNTSVFVQPDQSSAPNPAFVTAAPA